MSTEIRKELKIIPAQVKVVKHIRHVYACRQCEKNNISTPIITAKMPNPVLKGSFVSPSLMAYTMNRKYCEAVPLYRQEKQFNNFGIDISRQNLAGWVIHGANNWLKPLYDRIHTYLLKEDVIHVDETAMQVLDEKGKSLTSKSYMWLYSSGKFGKDTVERLDALLPWLESIPYECKIPKGGGYLTLTYMLYFLSDNYPTASRSIFSEASIE